jgi:T5SS/PEP-CTERM-associated repeat protein
MNGMNRRDATTKSPLFQRLSATASLTVIVLVTATPLAQAATANWVGTDGDWFSDANWAWTNATPTSADIASINTLTGPNLTLAGAAALGVYIGGGANGAMMVSGGGILATTSITLGNSSGVTGTLTVSAGQVTSTGAVEIGSYGTGKIYLTSGGTITAGDTMLASLAGTVGLLSVDGPGSTFTSTGKLTVGQLGSGDVDVTGGGSVSVAGQLVIGGTGIGTVDVGAGSTLTAGEIALGYSASSNGMLTVSGEGATVTATGNAYIGLSGAGRVDVKAGGSMTAVDTQVDGPGSNNLLWVDGAGSTYASTGTLGVGVYHNGSLLVTNGGAVTSAHAIIGWNASAAGTVTVEGAGSTWTNAGTLYVGNSGAGNLTIRDGGSVSTTGVYVATAGSSSGSNINVTGAGSTLSVEKGGTLNGALIVGETTAGSVSIDNGGTVSDYNGTLGNQAGSAGYMTVSGAGSQWRNIYDSSVAYSGNINVGLFGTGVLDVDDGGKVTGTRMYIGNETGSTGTVTVDGAGSSIDVTGNFYVGTSGDGTLTLSNGGSISAASVRIAYDSGTHGTLNIGAAHGSAAAAAGVINAPSVTFYDGTGVLTFNHTATDYVFAPTIAGDGTIWVDHGVTRLTGDSSGFSGHATVASGATLSIENGFGGSVGLTGATLNVSGALRTAATAAITGGGTIVNSGSISGADYGLNLTTASTLTNSGAISGGTAAVRLGANGNVLNIYDRSLFTGGVAFGSTHGNTLNFHTGSYTLPVQDYLLASNSINLLGSARTLITSGLNGSGTGDILVVDASAVGTLDRAASDVQRQVSGVIQDIMSLDVERPGAALPSSSGGPLGYADDRKKSNPTDIQVRQSPDAATAFDNAGNLYWLRGFYGGRHQGADGDVVGSNAHQFGTVTGVDHLYDAWRLGVFAGAGRSTNTLADGAGQLDADMALAGVYARRSFGALSLDAALTAGHIWATSERGINSGAEVAKGDFNGWFVAPEAALSLKYALDRNWSLTPSLKARYIATFYDGYTETGSSQNVSYDGHTTQALEERFDARLGYQTLTSAGLASRYWLSAGASATQRVGGSGYGATVSGTDFTVSPMGDGTVYGGLMSVGFDVMVSEKATLFGSLEGAAYTDNSRSGMARGGVKIAF